MISVVRIRAVDGSEWFVTVTDIATNKAACVAKEKSIDKMYALVQFVLPEFQKDPGAIMSWAKEKMKPEELNLIMLKQPNPPTKEEVLATGEWYYDK